MIRHEPFDLTKLSRPKPATPREPNGLQPELRPVRIPLDVDVNRFLPIRRVEEEPIRALTMNGRHEPSVTSLIIRRAWLD